MFLTHCDIFYCTAQEDSVERVLCPDLLVILVNEMTIPFHS